MNPADPTAARPETPTDSFGRPLADFSSRALAYIIDWVIRLGIIVGAIMVASLGSAGAIVAAVVGIPAFLYFCCMNGGRKGQTPGMKALGIRLTDATTGDPIGYGRAFVRWLLEVLMVLVVGIFWLVDLLWPLWDAQRQTIHDKAVGSLVICVRTPAAR
jgi:uncharacterized RDD family membrane protein YckC